MPRRTIRRAAHLIVVASLVAAVAIAPSAGVAAQQTPTTAPPTTLSLQDERVAPGRVAYVTPTGDVVVADTDGANPKVIGSGAAANAQGLAPLAWRQPAADAVTYVRNDGALITAPIDGSAPIVLATDAVVPAQAEENILSWDVSGSFLVYLGRDATGQVVSRIVDLTTADEGTAPQIRTVGNPDRRTVLAQAFSPLDPIIYQRTADPDTGRKFTLAIVEPFKGTIFGSRFSLDDVTFTPDGKYVFAVSGGSGNVEQMVRISMRRPTTAELVTDHDRVCRPAVSPDAKLIVFAAGRRCREVWTIRSNGTDPKRIQRRVGDGAVFDAGDFSWSTDGRTITHASCTRAKKTTTCGGGYWDIAVDGSSVDRRADAGSVLREQRPLLRPVKVKVDITGPIHYSGVMRMGAESVADPLSTAATDQVIHVKGVDDNDNSRSFELSLIHPESSTWIGGNLRIVDSGFDETFPFFGRILPYSLGYAKLRGIWLRSESIPLQAGHVIITIER